MYEFICILLTHKYYHYTCDFTILRCSGNNNSLLHLQAMVTSLECNGDTFVNVMADVGLYIPSVMVTLDTLLALHISTMLNIQCTAVSMSLSPLDLRLIRTLQ